MRTQKQVDLLNHAVQVCMRSVQSIAEQVAVMRCGAKRDPAEEVRAVFMYDARGRIQGAELSPVRKKR